MPEKSIDLFSSQPPLGPPSPTNSPPSFPQGDYQTEPPGPTGDGSKKGEDENVELVEDEVHVWALPVLRPVDHTDRARG